MPRLTSAQSMIDKSPELKPDNHTAREEKEGKKIWEKLQTKQLECKNLTDDNYGFLGEYFMGQMLGDTHESMNNMMIRMMNEEGEEQMHIVMGKRFSGCKPNTQSPQGGWVFIPMMWMMQKMKGGENPMMGQWGNMIGGWGGFSILGWLTMFLFWILIIVGILTLIRYLTKTGQTKEDKTSLDILKERYARGGINKKEFEEKKSDLNY